MTLIKTRFILGFSKTECWQTSIEVKLNDPARYFPCVSELVVSYVSVHIPDVEDYSLCEVEIFQTKICKFFSTLCNILISWFVRVMEILESHGFLIL